MAEPTIALFISEESPRNERWCACLYIGAKRLPIAFFGSDEDELRERAATWWREEREKEKRRKEASAQRGQNAVKSRRGDRPGS